MGADCYDSYVSALGYGDELPLMQLYRFAEAEYPEKAMGYYKDDGGLE
ncbi:MAG: hypothetical protein IJ874_06445 [Ruminococcus sp.]|nr:hypothetical protein [Ruminococcus sp.]